VVEVVLGAGMRGKGICIRNITADCPMCGDCDENIFLRFYFVVVVVVNELFSWRMMKEKVQMMALSYT
jgi:hypothetical protein